MPDRHSFVIKDLLCLGESRGVESVTSSSLLTSRASSYFEPSSFKSRTSTLSASDIGVLELDGVDADVSCGRELCDRRGLSRLSVKNFKILSNLKWKKIRGYCVGQP